MEKCKVVVELTKSEIEKLETLTDTKLIDSYGCFRHEEIADMIILVLSNL